MLFVPRWGGGGASKLRARKAQRKSLLKKIGSWRSHREQNSRGAGERYFLVWKQRTPKAQTSFLQMTNSGSLPFIHKNTEYILPLLPIKCTIKISTRTGTSSFMGGWTDRACNVFWSTFQIASMFNYSRPVRFGTVSGADTHAAS